MSEYLKVTKAIIFDFDDTLVGTHKAIWGLHRHIAKTHYGIELTDDALHEYWGQPIDVLIRNYYQTDDTKLGMQHLLDEHTLFPKQTFSETMPTLRALKSAGKILGIVSASNRSILENDAIKAGIDLSLIDYLQTSEDTNVHKPDPHVFDPLHVWLKVQDIQPNEVTYVGDGLHDAVAAAGAGFQFVGVETGLVTKVMFKDAGFVSVSGLAKLVDDNTN